MECHFTYGVVRSMYVALMLFGCTLGGCSPSYPTPAHPSMVEAVLDGPDGPATVVDLKTRYDDLSMECHGEPAVRCTGIILEASELREPWQPFADNGVPTSWFRADAPITGTYPPGAGMLYYSAATAPRYGKLAQHVLCAYVINAFTDFRPSRCGDFDDPHRPESGPCQPQGIDTAAKWHAHMRRNPQYPNQDGGWQCGFDLTAADGTEVFSHFPTLMREYRETVPQLTQYNELVVASWPRGLPTRVPIEAFFYDTAKMPASLERAQGLQVIMNDEGGIWRPVVAITFPASFGDRASFDYRDVDQARPVPGVKTH